MYYEQKRKQFIESLVLRLVEKKKRLRYKQDHESWAQRDIIDIKLDSLYKSYLTTKGL